MVPDASGKLANTCLNMGSLIPQKLILVGLQETWKLQSNRSLIRWHAGPPLFSHAPMYGYPKKAHLATTNLCTRIPQRERERERERGVANVKHFTISCVTTTESSTSLCMECYRKIFAPSNLIFGRSASARSPASKSSAPQLPPRSGQTFLALILRQVAL